LKKNIVSPFFLLTLLLTVNLPKVEAQSFILTVTTSKQYYYLDETIHIYGNLTLDGNLTSDALVGLEVENSKNQSIIIRTIPTGDVSNKTWFIEILNVYPCDRWGTPKFNFSIGTLSYFNVTIKNNDIENHWVYISVNTYDSSNTPIGITAIEYVAYANYTGSQIISVPVPSTASNGTGKAYANVYSLNPKRGGKPYGPEKFANFNITNSSVIPASQPNPPTLNGNYNCSFHLPPNAPAGLYQVFATSMYNGWLALNTTTFYVKVPGDVNGDFRVNLADLSYLGVAWWSKPGSPNWNPNCDFNNDLMVNLGDVALLGRYWGYPW